MSSTDTPAWFDCCREGIDELLEADADISVVECAIDAYALEREEKDALWLWAVGRHDRLRASRPRSVAAWGSPGGPTASQNMRFPKGDSS